MLLIHACDSVLVEVGMAQLGKSLFVCDIGHDDASLDKPSVIKY
jgi:hypothetical protein